MENRRYPTDAEAKKLIVEIGRRMYAKNFVAANDGNISCKVDENTIWTTPTGVSKGFMTEDMLVKLRLDGTVISQGERGPSSEVKMHLRVYNENPDVGGVCHAHPPISTSFAIAGMSLDRAIYPEALVNLGTVPCVHYETPGSQGIPDSVAPYCKDYNALLLANACFDTLMKVGWPEGRIPLAEATIYLATSPKSNSAYMAINNALELVRETGNLPVPLHLRNAPTKLMKQLGYGEKYKYAHDYPGNFVKQQFLPDELKDRRIWEPQLNPAEQKHKERMQQLWGEEKKW